MASRPRTPNPHAALERRAGFRRAQGRHLGPLDHLERLADLEIKDKRFRARASGVDAAVLGEIRALFGDDVGRAISFAALRLSMELVQLWKWQHDYPGPLLSPVTNQLRGVDASWQSQVMLWIGRARLLAQHDRARKIKMYRVLPRGSDGRVAWNLLEPLQKHPWHAPLTLPDDRDARRVPIELRLWSPEERADERHVREVLAPFRDRIQELHECITGSSGLMALVMAVRRAQDGNPEPKDNPGLPDDVRAELAKIATNTPRFDPEAVDAVAERVGDFEEFLKLCQGFFDTLERPWRLMMESMWPNAISTPVDITKKQNLLRPIPPIVSEIAVDLVVGFAKRLPRRRGRAELKALSAGEPQQYRRHGRYRDAILDQARLIIRLTYDVDIPREELHSKVLERDRSRGRS